MGVLHYKGAPLLLKDSQIYIGEDVARPDGIKIPRETAIPAGDYFLEITYSHRFWRMMPLIYNTPEKTIVSGTKIWTGVRVHQGNTEADTDACQLTGLGRNAQGVWRSNDAFILFYAFLERLIEESGGKIPYRIINAQIFKP